MEYVVLGRTGLKVSRLGAGCWGIGGPFINLGIAGGWDNADEKEAKKSLYLAFRMGVNIFDTADVYGFGASERLLGWLVNKLKKEGVKREEIVIISKVGYFFGCAPHGYYPLHMKHQLEMSLDNLKSKYIDIYFFHHHDFGKKDKYLDAAVKTMREFKKKGLINFIGLRGPHQFLPSRKFKPQSYDELFKRFVYLCEIIDPDVVGVKYNMLETEVDSYKTDIFKWLKRKGIGIVIYEPLAHGLLTNKYNPNNPPKFSEGDHRSRKFWFTPDGLRIISSKLAILGNKFKCKTTKDFTHLALKFCLTRCKEAVILVGFKNRKQVEENFSVKGELSKKDVKYIREVFSNLKVSE
jgi:aryl-alcohol dehydrogenase-like predicted oxidoreductase